MNEQLQRAFEPMPDIVGGRLCLDFVNTIEPHGGLDVDPEYVRQCEQREYFTDYSKFLAWSVRVNILTEEEALYLLQQSQLQFSEPIMTNILQVRDLIYHLFWNIARDNLPGQTELDQLQEKYLEALSHAHLRKSENHVSWQWLENAKKHLTYPLWPILHSAVDLLKEGDYQRIKVCPGVPGDALACAWLFYDESKNRKRHWCSMEDCGNAAKSRRLTERRRQHKSERAG